MLSVGRRGQLAAQMERSQYPTPDPRTGPAGSDLTVLEEQIEGADWEGWRWAKWEWGRKGRAHLKEQRGGIIPWQYFQIHLIPRVLLI